MQHVSQGAPYFRANEYLVEISVEISPLWIFCLGGFHRQELIAKIPNQCWQNDNKDVPAA